MKPISALLAFASLFLALPVLATPRVVSQRSEWDAARRYIWSDLEIEHDDGRRETVRVPGGSVDGVAMRQFMSWGEDGPPTVNYVAQVTTKSKTRMRWRSGCVFITADARGSTDIGAEQEFSIIKRVLENWQEATGACSYLQFRRNVAWEGDLGYDGVNRITFREQAWCPPDVEPGSAGCYPIEATAITTVFHVDNPARPDDGMILDADIELNSVHYAMATSCETTCQSTGSGDLEDLENTLTHEMGHLVGLDHPCWTPRRNETGAIIDSPPLDDQGNEAPPCDPVTGLTPDILEATMYARQSPGEVKKRSLVADDIRGFCALYPSASDPGTCEPMFVDAGGCRVHREDAPLGDALITLALLAGTILVVRRRA